MQTQHKVEMQCWNRVNGTSHNIELMHHIENNLVLHCDTVHWIECSESWTCWNETVIQNATFHTKLKSGVKFSLVWHDCALSQTVLLSWTQSDMMWHWVHEWCWVEFNGFCQRTWTENKIQICSFVTNEKFQSQQVPTISNHFHDIIQSWEWHLCVLSCHCLESCLKCNSWLKCALCMTGLESMVAPFICGCIVIEVSFSSLSSAGKHLCSWFWFWRLVRCVPHTASLVRKRQAGSWTNHSVQPQRGAEPLALSRTPAPQSPVPFNSNPQMQMHTCIKLSMCVCQWHTSAMQCYWA